MCGHRASDDATLQITDQTNYHGKLRSIDKLDSKPFAGRRFAIVKETMGETPFWRVLNTTSSVIRTYTLLGHLDLLICTNIPMVRVGSGRGRCGVYHHGSKTDGISRGELSALFNLMFS